MENEEILKIKNIYKSFFLNPGFFSVGEEKKVLKNVSLNLKKNSILGVVGESGCGKSTLARVIMGLTDCENGEIEFGSYNNILKLKRSEFKNIRKKIQMVFQDPYSSIDPKFKIIDIVSEPLIIDGVSKKEASEKAGIILEKIGFNRDDFNKYPHEFSGGQRQRIGIARSLILEPEILIADEPVSALDVSIQAQILDLLLNLKSEMNLSIIFISHDLSVVRAISDELAVMYSGKIVEMGDSEEIFSKPLHPYTHELINAVPGSGVSEEEIISEEYIDENEGCPYRNRCKYRLKKCENEFPQIKKISDSHFIHCFK